MMDDRIIEVIRNESRGIAWFLAVVVVLLGLILWRVW